MIPSQGEGRGLVFERRVRAGAAVALSLLATCLKRHYSSSWPRDFKAVFSQRGHGITSLRKRLERALRESRAYQLLESGLVEFPAGRVVLAQESGIVAAVVAGAHGRTSLWIWSSSKTVMLLTLMSMTISYCLTHLKAVATR